MAQTPTPESFMNYVIVKGVYCSMWATHLKATERHLPYGVTRCCLLSDTGKPVSYTHLTLPTILRV